MSISSTEHELEDQINEWANMTGFLLALGGVCLQQKKSPGMIKPNAIASDQGKKGMVSSSVAVASAATPQLPHGGVPAADQQYCPVTAYLGNLLKLLVCPNEKFGPQIQKHVKELVGHDMSPLLYPILFDQIKLIVEKFFDATGQVRILSFGLK